MLHKRADDLIVRPDATRGSTRCFLIEEVSSKAADAGYKRGDIVVPKHVSDQFHYNGAYHRGCFLCSDIVNRVHAPISEFVDLHDKPIDVPWANGTAGARAVEATA